jgi:hypothetical protein
MSFAGDLTPDQETGMGEWSQARLSKSQERANTRSTQRSRYFAADAMVQHEKLDRGRLEGDVGIPAKHSAGQKSGAVPDTSAASSKPRSKIANCQLGFSGRIGK